MLSNFKFLANNYFKIDNLYQVNKYVKNSNNELEVQEYKKVDIEHDYDELYKDFIDLGKRLYNEYRDDIDLITKENVPFPTLVKYKDSYKYREDYITDSRRVKIIDDWLKNLDKCYLYLENDYNPDTNDVRIETFYLSDIALFSYLVLTSINNYCLLKDKKFKTKESEVRKKYERKYKKILNNDIYFNTFTSAQKNDIDHFIDIINFYIYNFEAGYNRVILTEHSQLIYDTSSMEHHYKYIKSYKSIYGLYWYILKMQIYSILNGYLIVNMCSCGNIITGKAKQCPTCLKLWDSFRNCIKYHTKRKED